MEIKYCERFDLTDFFLKLENAMKAASEATESIPKSWQHDLRIWKGQRKYIRYEDLKQSIEGKVRDVHAEERYTLAKGTPETPQPKRSELLRLPDLQCRTLKTAIMPLSSRPRHNIRQCRGLQKDLRDGRVKAETVLPANFAFKGNSKHDHPYQNSNNGNNGRNYKGYNNRDFKGNNGGNKKNYGNGGKQRGSDRYKDRPLESDDDEEDDDNSDVGNNRKISRQGRRDTGLIVVATTISSPFSLTAQAKVEPDLTWTIDAGCTCHLSHESQWFIDISTSGGSITVRGNNQIPIEGNGRVEPEVFDSKDTMQKLILHGVMYAPHLQLSLLSVPAAVKHDYRFSFDHKQCAM
ncbi:hypothetical protein PHMEG_00034464 [Phytophthora megakarya]|uniref:Retrovirus-related Pol polyprotein from transposon TNT 1-94-like beta-barrel domain-containing protein n=1 Tax=Phytophthora megakarya TaxID=4795 RepID=A0A225UQZ6_9STRA|nr:hypothetical protein PHMEG_00034464 [Phytophthora megakarya]